MSVPESVSTTYEPFSVEPEYVEANRGFVHRQPLSQVRRFLDLACGTGTVSELLVEQSPAAHLNGIDLDPMQIQLCTERFTRMGYTVRPGFELTDEVAGGKPVIVLGVRSADELPFPDATFDCVTIANAIHMMPDKPRFLAEVARVLRPGGVFGFNSSFYSGSMPEGTDRIYFDWIRLSSDYLQQKSAQRVAEGKPPIKRVRGTTRSAFKNPWFTAAQWQQMLADAGMALHDTNERRVELNERCLGLVGAYGGLAEVLMSGFPVEEAAEALQMCAGAALDASGVRIAPRNYLEMWATRQ